ncbi:MAG TPA: gamma-glutamyltransferase, partial [Emcibacteraceae bacterium]|nr:gamma-glutamyltransferase [Emcibacteraceae bacterium]
KNGKPYMVTGSPGGSTIITVVLQMVLNVLEFDMNIAEASAAPRIHHQWWPDKVVLEQGISQDTFAILKSRGFKLSGDRINSPGENKTVMGRTNSIIFDNGVFTGYSDLRGIEHGVAGY